MNRPEYKYSVIGNVKCVNVSTILKMLELKWNREYCVSNFSIWRSLPILTKAKKRITRIIRHKKNGITYVDWNVCVSSCLSSPFGLIVNILIIGMPTARYAQTSCKIYTHKMNTHWIELIYLQKTGHLWNISTLTLILLP